MKRTLLFIQALLLLTSMAQATTYYVATTGNDANPGTQAQPFKTIQKGLNTAVTGDFVLVADGTYTGVGNRDLNYNGKNLTLKSLGGATRCIIDCQQETRGISFRSGESAAAVLDGFTIQNGRRSQNSPNTEGGGINIGGNVFSSVPTSPTIKNCILRENSSIAAGGAVGVNSQCAPTFINCLVTRNSGVSGGAFRVAGSPVLINCTIVDNTSLWYTREGQVTITNCILWNNGPSVNGEETAFIITYSNIDYGAAGTGNLSHDPRFLSAASGDYRLKSASPCVGTGNATAVPSGITTDLSGSQRLLGDRVSMGAYELSSTYPTIINTDALTINGISTVYNGYSMSAQVLSGQAIFNLYGNFMPPAGPIAVIGSRPLLLNAHNNIEIQTGSTLDVSGYGPNSVAGGGAGGNGRGQLGPAGGRSTGGALGEHGFNGDNGTTQSGMAALDGLSGLAGQNGFGLATGGGAGGGGYPNLSPGSPAPGGSVGLGGVSGVHFVNNFNTGGKAGGAGGNGQNGTHSPLHPDGVGPQAGRGGRNSGGGLTGGSGGGAGGGGSTGTSGGSGGGGGGGGGGADQPLIFLTAQGGNGGSGGKGGDGGQGGAGAAGGHGGAGGGVVKLQAYGRLTLSGSVLSRGGAGGDARSGGAGSAGGRGEDGANGSKGQNGQLDFGGSFGTGGKNGGAPATNGGDANNAGSGGGGGGAGGNGGNGGNGMFSGAGGGGAGGTICLIGSVVSGSVIIDCSGGTGGGTAGIQGAQSGEEGSNGFYVSGSNVDFLNNTVIGATGQNVVGPRKANELVSGQPQTPYIPGLPFGAHIYGLSGLTASDFSGILTNAPANAVAALYRVNIGPGVYNTDFNGFDYLCVINLRNDTLPNPRLGVGATNFVTDLRSIAQPFHADTSAVLGQLEGRSVYITQIPSGVTGPFNFTLAAWGEIASTPALANGEVFYILRPANNLYVDIATGNDNHPGTPAQPFKTVTKAITVAQAGDNIYVKQGNYGSDRPRITKFVHIKNWGNTGQARIGKP